MGALQSISHVLPGGKPLAPALTTYLEQGLVTVGVGG